MEAPVYDQGEVRLFHGEALSILREMPDDSIHSVICDPQYGLSQASSAATISAIAAWVSGDRERVPNGRGFMGKDWDSFVPPPAIWDECLRVLTPGGHMFAFAGSRTADLAGVSIRLAGFEIRDAIDCIGSRVSWLYGTGWPKAKTVLKPAHEPILVARKPFSGSEVATVRRYGTGALNIDGCRVAGEKLQVIRRNTALGIMNDDEWQPKPTVFKPHPSGRWPSNVVLIHFPLLDPVTGEVIGDACAGGCQPGCVVRELDAQSGVLTSGKRADYADNGRTSGKISNEGGAMPGRVVAPFAHDGDSGGASRFFSCFRWEAKAPQSERPKINGEGHPCVKPLSLMRWLARLSTPAGGTILDWCAGSGTTGEAARLEGFPAILIERESEYIPYILQRLGRCSP